MAFGEVGGCNLASPRGALRLRVGNFLLGAVEEIIHLVVGSVLLVVEDDFGRLAFDERRFPRRLRRIDQMIAFDVALRVCRHDFAGVPIERVGRGKLLAGALLQVLHVASEQFVPRRRERDVVVGHDKLSPLSSVVTPSSPETVQPANSYPTRVGLAFTVCVERS